MSERAVSNILSGLVCLLLGTVIFVVLITGQKTEEPEYDFSAGLSSNRALNVSTTTADPQDSFTVNRVYNGITKAKNAVDLSFSEPGRIDSIKYGPGEKVKKDTVLAELDKGTKLLAPFDGIISTKRMTVGSVAGPGNPVLRLVQSDDLEVWFNLPIDVAEDINTGDTYELEISGKDHLIVASGVLPEIDPNGRTRTVFFSLPEKISDQHLPGETVRLQIPRVVVVKGYWLPLKALTRESRGMWSIFVIKKGDQTGDLVERRFVEVYQVNDDRAWIKGAIDNRTLIISDGAHRVVPGQRVKATRQSN